MKRIRCTVTVHDNSHLPYTVRGAWWNDYGPAYDKAAWLTDLGVLCWCDKEGNSGPNRAEFTLRPAPDVTQREWVRTSANHETLLVKGGGGRKYTIRADDGAEWEECEAPWQPAAVTADA